jgi:hypothetical protein
MMRFRTPSDVGFRIHFGCSEMLKSLAVGGKKNKLEPVIERKRFLRSSEIGPAGESLQFDVAKFPARHGGSKEGWNGQDSKHSEIHFRVKE